MIGVKITLFDTQQPDMAQACASWLLESFDLKIWVETTDKIRLCVECPEGLIGTLQIKAIAFARGWNAKK